MKQTVFVSILIYLMFLVLLTSESAGMFADPDTGWHLATGDLIRTLGAIPAHDTWSFTAGDTKWLNTSWAYDIAASFIYQHFSWYGLAVANSILIAATLALIFATALIRTQSGAAAFVTVLLVMLLIPTSIRPHQISFLFTALLALMLSLVANRHCAKYWLLAVPLLMIAWCNLYGGFLIAFTLIGAYALDAWLRRDWPLARWLMATGIIAVAACLINPYGLDIATAVMRSFTSHDKLFISEWKPLTFSSTFLIPAVYIALFVGMAATRTLPASRSERWLMLGWLMLGMMSNRYMIIFAIVSAPLFALELQQRIGLPAGKAPPALLPATQRLCAYVTRLSRSCKGVALLLGAAGIISGWLLVAQPGWLAAIDSPIANAAEESAFILEYYPHARLLTSYNLGGSLIFYQRGRIPVFIDGRTWSAYPPALIDDFQLFLTAGKDWEQVLERYRIDGVVVPVIMPDLLDRFTGRKGWTRVFTGKTAIIFMRDKIGQ